MTRQAMKRPLQRIGAGLLLVCALSVPQANAQAAPGTKGTRQRVANPLNDLLDESRRYRNFSLKGMILRTRIFSWDMHTLGCRKAKRRAANTNELCCSIRKCPK